MSEESEEEQERSRGFRVSDRRRCLQYAIRRSQLTLKRLLLPPRSRLPFRVSFLDSVRRRSCIWAKSLQP